MRYACLILLCSLAAPRWALPAPSPEAFGLLPSVYDAAISPDSSRIAAFVNVNGAYGIRVFSVAGKNEEPRIIRLTEGVKPQWIKWANDERVLVGLWQSALFEKTPITANFIYTLDTASMQGRILIDPKYMFRQNNADVVDFLEDDPDHILMAFSKTDRSLAHIQKVNVATGEYRRIQRGERDIQFWYTDRRGEPRIGQGRPDRVSTSEKWKLLIREADGKKWRSADEYPGLEPDTAIFGFTGNPNEIVIGDRAGKDTLGLYIYDLAKKQLTRRLFHNDNYDASGLIFSGNGHEVIGAKFVADTTETELFDEYDTVLGRVRDRFRNYVVDYIDQSADGSVVIFAMSNASDPGALMMVDAASGDISRLSSYRPALPADEMGNVISVHYKARDDFTIPAYMTLPPSVTGQKQLRNLPFIVLPHGGPYARSSKRFDYFAQFFATRGFGVLQMNFRGSAGYGKAFEDAGRRNWVVMQEDVEDGTRWLLENGYADPQRVCIAGWSYGGYAALMGAIANPELYACAVSMAGVTDLQDTIRDIGKYRFGKMAARKFILQGFEDKDAIRENSPVRRADELRVPLFLAHGTVDQRVHFDQFKRMKYALRKNPVDVTYMEFEGEDHFLSHQDHRQQFFGGLSVFLNETVGVSEFVR